MVAFFVLSLFVQRKNQRKGAGNDNFSLFVRPLHKAFTRHQTGRSSHHFRFAPELINIGVLKYEIPLCSSVFFIRRSLGGGGLSGTSV